jgi:hypothetical protein
MFSLLDASSRAAILGKREAYLRWSAERFGPLESGMEIGTYGREVVRFMRQQINAELAWIEQLRHRDRSQKRKAQTNKE